MSEEKTLSCIDDDCDSGHPYTVIVDLVMEEVDAGLAFVQAVRAKTGAIPVYLFRSVGDNLSGMTRFGDLGFSGVRRKPIDVQILPSTVRSCIE